MKWIRLLAPLLMLVAVAAVEMSNEEWIVLELAVLGPMLAATLSGPRVTAVYAAAALAVGALLGLHDDLYSSHSGGPAAQMVRLGGVAVGGVMAILAGRYHSRREKKLENVTRVAEVAQRAILASVPASLGGLGLAVRYESAAAQAMVGGDLYEVVDSRWGVRIIVGDVRGKGLDAVQIASRVLGCFRTVARRIEDLRDVIFDLDEEVVEASGLDDFVTAIVVQVRGHDLVLVNAGHPDPVLLRAGTTRLLTSTSRLPPLGLLALGAGRTDVTVADLDAGDRLLLYTDGLAEARHPITGEFFPLLRVAQGVLGHPHLDAGLAGLVHELQQWSGSRLNDDVALLAAEVRAGVVG